MKARQTMTLDEIEKALVAIKAGKREYEAVTGSVYINGEWEAEFATEAEAQFYILAPEYVRTLLAIAKAAVEYKADGGYKAMAKLFDLLKELSGE